MSNLVEFFLVTVFLLLSALSPSTQQTQIFFPGFKHADTNLTLTGAAEIEKNGLIRLTNDTSRLIGHAFYTSPFLLKNITTHRALSFSTCFAFSIVPEYPKLGGHGLAFAISSSKDLKALPSQYLGLFNASDVGNFTNHVFAVEFDTVQDFEFGDINDNHIGIDINSLRSNASVPAAYYIDKITKQNITLKSGVPILAWVDYDSIQNIVSVSISPSSEKPILPILSYPVDLSPIFEDYMYVGFSSSTGLLASSHFLLGWSFCINGRAQNLDLSSLPSLPSLKKHHTGLTVGVSVTSVVFALILTAAAIFYVIRKIKDTDVIEDWELEIGPHRYSYQELKKATRGFSENELLGRGGFGQVYKGTLPDSKLQVAVKKVSNESKQGLREFVSEIGSIGRLRHRNLVQLLGWCRRKDDLLIVYDFMSNGSLDRYLFDEPKMALSWDQRFKIIKDVASGLLYLHEGYEQVVIHRDVKASNVLLDGDLSGRLGDFGLARLYEHGANPSTTRVVGTLGYLAPELPRTGKATASSDVFAFGAFLLEVACGRRPIDPKASPEELVLVDLVWDKFKDKNLLNVVDHRLRGDYNEKEMLMVLKLGIMCSNCVPSNRPSMRQVLKFLDGEIELPESVWPPNSAYDAGNGQCEGFDAFFNSLASSSFDKMSSHSMFMENGDVGTSFAFLSTSPLSLLHDGPR